jgi:hypothetical protein
MDGEMTDFDYEYGIPQGREMQLIFLADGKGGHNCAYVALTAEDVEDFSENRLALTAGDRRVLMAIRGSNPTEADRQQAIGLFRFMCGGDAELQRRAKLLESP